MENKDPANHAAKAKHNVITASRCAEDVRQKESLKVLLPSRSVDPVASLLAVYRCITVETTERPYSQQSARYSHRARVVDEYDTSQAPWKLSDRR